MSGHDGQSGGPGVGGEGERDGREGGIWRERGTGREGGREGGRKEKVGKREKSTIDP